MLPSVPVAPADLVLAAVALPMILAALVGFVHSVQLGVALGAGSVPAGGTIGYALFYDPPSDG
jgi:hypothetical protein